MAVDVDMAERVREALSDRAPIREVTMFGGLAFMLEDRMVVCVSSGGGALLVRISPERDADYLTRDGAHRAEMGKGRSMGEGWVSVDKEALEEDDQLAFWLTAALDFHARGSGKTKRTPTTS